LQLSKQKRDWDELGELDPLWAVLTEPEQRFGSWDLSAFFRTGQEEIAEVLAVAKRLERPARFERVLDFGCGVGRLTRALAPYFNECYGTDVSECMINQAIMLNKAIGNCKFVLNVDSNLERFADGHFDLVITRRVLQHLPSQALIRTYLRELVRVLAAGGLLVFQVPSFIPPRRRMQLRRRAYAVLHALGVSPRVLYEKLTLNPMRMSYLPKDEVESLLTACGSHLLHTAEDNHLQRQGMTSWTYYVSR